MPIKYVPFIPEPVEGQAVLGNFNRILRYKGADEVSMTTQRGKCMLKAICEEMGFDSLGYQSLDGLLEAIGLDKDKVCTYCWNGKE